jgi:hypothetical protein
MKDKNLGNSFRHAYNIGELNFIKRSGLLTAKDNQDFYRFRIGSNSSSSEVDFWVFKPMQGVDIQLFKSDRTPAKRVRNILTNPPLNCTFLKPGTYFFKVSSERIEGERTYKFSARAGDSASGVSRPGSLMIDLLPSSIVQGESTIKSPLSTLPLSQPAIPSLQITQPEANVMELDQSFSRNKSATRAIIIDESPFLVDNEINGSNKGEQLLGDDRSNAISGKGGDDQLSGLGSFDFIEGGSGNDRLSGGGDGDRLFGNQGNDTLIGGSGNDTLYGDAGNDRLRGGAGIDVLIGGSGNNRLVGGGGTDAFILSLDEAFDTVVDFQNGLDRLGLPTGVGFEKLQIVQQGADTAVRYVEDPFLRVMPPTIALLKGIQANTITAADFANVVAIS